MSVSASGPPKPAPKPKPSSSYVLSTDRETSSIPRYISSNPPDNAAVAAASCSQSSNWVYPSPSQFFTALERKNRNPDAADMDIVVPIHNAVNERTWKQVLEWEEEAAPDAVNKVKLVSFKGRPNDRTPRAWFKVLLGYQAPFDRHDWTIDRDGKRIRYVIDFYTGRGGQPAALPAGPTLPLQLAFYLDVRPAFDDFESIRMRFRHGLNSLVGLTGPPKQTKLG
ncbi:Cytochrome c1 heme lyase [Cystobasidiomycetes sp. EMM_F5]